jgi:mRNA-degrading endonuclease toxin of MazEF toxin-antitoxin module
VVLPLTTRVVEGDAFPLRLRVRAGVCGLASDRDVRVEQSVARDNELFRTDLGPLPEALQDEVRRALLEFLDLS